jgi:hypothetical protein
MGTTGQHQGAYTFANIGHEIATQGPPLVRELPRLVSGLVGTGKVSPEARVAAQLRMAKLFGCPVCLHLFPRIAASVGLDAAAVESAKHGVSTGLSPEAHGAVVWVGEVVSLEALPEVVPGPAMNLSATQREGLVAMVRLDRIIHAVGLFFLPHAVIERALGA